MTDEKARELVERLKAQPDSTESALLREAAEALTARLDSLEDLRDDLSVARHAVVKKAAELRRLNADFKTVRVTLRAIAHERHAGVRTAAAQAAFVILEQLHNVELGIPGGAAGTEAQLAELFTQLVQWPVELSSNAEGRAAIRHAGSRALELLGVCSQLLDVEQLYARTCSKEEVTYVNAQRGFVIGDLRKVLECHGTARAGTQALDAPFRDVTGLPAT
jgi:biotin operon repressor